MKRQKKAESRIVMRVSYRSRRLEFQTGIKIGDRNFDFLAQKVVGKRRSNVPVKLYAKSIRS